jgi:hypothetical protein
MATTTKSPLQVLLMAYQVGRLTLRLYAHRFSPKKFTQPQLFAALVLKGIPKGIPEGIPGTAYITLDRNGEFRAGNSGDSIHNS